MVRKFIIGFMGLFLLAGCNDENGQALLPSGQSCGEVPDPVVCSEINSFSKLMSDGFARDTVVPEFLDDLIGWRRIIDDRGRIVADQAGNNVNVEITDSAEFGPAAEGEKYLTFYGRDGSSVHNVYLVTDTLSIRSVNQSANVVLASFKYIPVHLEASEYLKFEVCNATADECGVGQDITLAALNDETKWRTLFETSAADLGLDYDGYNHVLADYVEIKVPFHLEEFQRDEFVVRFNVRVDEGFIGNNRSNGLEDGVLLDEVRINAYDVPKVDETTDEALIEEILLGDFNGIL